MTENEALSFLELAREDLHVAVLIENERPRQAAFHLQQAVEKALKAVLGVEGLPVPRIHSIADLVGQLPDDHPWRAPLLAFDRLTWAATTMRYPLSTGGLAPPPEPAAIAAIRQDVAALLDALAPWVRARLAG